MKKLLLTLAVTALSAITICAQDIYVIGTNVNGKSWTLASPDAKFTKTGTNTYEWTGETLGTGFKFNNGTWSNDAMNWGSKNSSDKLTLGQPFQTTAGGGSGNIALAEGTEVQNPKIVMTWDGTNPPTIVLTGNGGGEVQWYVAGFNGNFVVGDSYGAVVLWETEETGIYRSEPFEVTVPTGEFKIASTGWSEEYGIYDNPPTLSLSNMEFTLEEVVGEAGNIPYNLPVGFYSCEFNMNTLVAKFTQEGNIDYSGWWVNIIGPFNNWADNGEHPDGEGLTTHKNLPIDAEGFKVKVNTGGENDTYYITGDETPIELDTWVNLYVDTTDGPRIYVNGANGQQTYDVLFNVQTNQLMVKTYDGVENIAVDAANATPVYFNLQGIRIERPEQGQMYIVRTGNNVSKIIR